MGRNAGFAPAVNRGIREARGEWLAILNSDVELAPDYLEKLARRRRALRHRQDPQHRTALSTATFDLTTPRRHDLARRRRHDRRTALRSPARNRLAALDRRCSATPMSSARAGLLEESFESYLEDVEFGLRCARLGIAGRYVPEARAVHTGQRHAGTMASGNRAPHRAQPVAARRAPSARAAAGGPSWPGSCSGARVAFRHGTALAWLRGKCARPAPVSPSPPRIQRLMTRVLTKSNEQFICKP